MSFEILGFARQNSLLSAFLDKIMAKLESAILVDCPQKGMDFCKYAYLSASEIGYEGKSSLALIQKESFFNTGYITRKNDDATELPYLDRWLDALSVEGAPVKTIAIVLYSKEQLAKEGIAIEADWGIVTAQAEPDDCISPMPPATILRNALGVEFGGNGTPIDREYYNLSVAYWSKWAIVK